MQVKVFSGPTPTAVLSSIKAELGSDAVILDTRETKEDGQTLITMTVALDRDSTEKTSEDSGGGSFARALDSAQAEYPPDPPAPSSLPPGWQLWHEEWSSIKSHLMALMKSEIQVEKLSPRQRVAVEFLQREGVNDTVMLGVYTSLLQRPGASVLDPLAEMISVKAWGREKWKQKIQIIAGPYGVGKTTVVVRLALWLRKANPSLRVCLVNADGERGGGRLLLKNYAELSDLEYREAGSKLEIAAIFAEDARNNLFDIILVDTPALGRGKTMSRMLTELGLARNDAALHLVLAPHYSESIYPMLLERYSPGKAGPREMGLIWSKLDEVEKFGQVINVSASSHLPISALSYGPGLLNTLLPARDTTLWRLLFKRELPDAVHAA